MKLKSAYLVLLFTICMLIGVFVYYVFFFKSANRVCFDSNCFDVSLAITPTEHAIGLMDVPAMPKDKGMLFIFDKVGLYQFWMKDTLIPLDMIRMDESKNIVFISKNTKPCGQGDCPLINPGKDSKYVLEINAGLVDSLGIKLGDSAKFIFSDSVKPGLDLNQK